MRFGLGVPTGGEGLMYPIPFASVGEVVELAEFAEDLGFDSIWANDHLVSQQYVAEQFGRSPRYYDPFTYLAYAAARTEQIRLATCIAVLGFRHPAVLTKAATTLDHLSGGRTVLGVGIGAYREELDRLWPDRTINRGRHAAESIEVISRLLTEDRVTFDGEFVQLDDVDLQPKSFDGVIPILCGGNSKASRLRAATFGSGWMPASQRPEDIVAGLKEIYEHAESIGRQLPKDFEVAPQMGLSLGESEKQAWDRFSASQLFVHKKSLAQSTLRDQQDSVHERNLIGTPAQIIDRVNQYRDAGVNTFAGLLFSVNTVEELREQMQWFSESVIRVVNGPAS